MSKIQDLAIVQNTYSGKVRDIYDLGDKLLIVTSDRISAFDCVFPNTIPNKGKILNQISVFFFNATKEIIPNHFITDKVDEYPEEFKEFENELKDRSMLVKKSRVIPYEAIVRGYITGSAWKEYNKSKTVGGIIQPTDLKESQKFPEPIFTPSTKAESGHDENISFEEMKRRMDPSLAEKIKKVSLDLFNFAHEILFSKDIILADTKFEFGSYGGELILIDEVLTPDSSRFWDKNEYHLGTTLKSYDKQYIRDFISDSGWDKNPPAPELPQNVIDKTYGKYYSAYKIICGENTKSW
jgi:phosphoribosylaminoimidazole-succinocarboxamide synthase